MVHLMLHLMGLLMDHHTAPLMFHLMATAHLLLRSRTEPRDPTTDQKNNLNFVNKNLKL